jgi:hypothetical protein
MKILSFLLNGNMDEPGEIKKMNPKRVDVVIIMDVTGSMGSYIRNARDTVLEAFDALRTLYPDCEFRLAFTGYRDYGDKEQFVVIPFTTDIESVRHEISRIHAFGGDDTPENVAGAFKKTSELDWKGDVKTIFFVTDAPAHGTDYHPITMGDRYPRGDPEGLDPKQQAAEFARQGIDLTLFRVTPQVDMMIEQFHLAYKDSSAVGLFTVLDVEKQLNSISDSYDELDMDRGLSDEIEIGSSYETYSKPSSSSETCIKPSRPSFNANVFKTGLVESASASVNRRK